MSEQAFATVTAPWGDHFHGEVLEGEDAAAALADHPDKVVRTAPPQKMVEEASPTPPKAPAPAPADAPKP